MGFLEDLFKGASDVLNKEAESIKMWAERYSSYSDTELMNKLRRGGLGSNEQAGIRWLLRKRGYDV